jgi:predicted small secreted protein
MQQYEAMIRVQQTVYMTTRYELYALLLAASIVASCNNEANIRVQQTIYMSTKPELYSLLLAASIIASCNNTRQ